VAIRQYDFLVSVETPNTPTVEDPVSDSSVVNSGYLNDRWYWGASVADYAALRALTTDQRIDNQIRNVDTGTTPELWKLDAASVTADDGATVLKPTDTLIGDPGRWHILTTGGGGGGGGGAAGLDVALQKISYEKFGFFSDRIENALTESFTSPIRNANNRLLENYTAASTNIKYVVNPVHVNSSDQPFDTTTNWTAGGAGASLTTSATRKVGSTSLQFDKNGTGTLAFIQNTANTYNVNGNTIFFMWVNMPSITNFSLIGLTLSPDSGFAAQAQFDVTTDFAGNAIAVGWNLIRIDVSGTPTATVGAGWTPAQTVLATGIRIQTTTAGQTYTGILVDAVAFGDSTGQFVQVGDKLTVFDGSTRDSFVIDSANTSYQGSITMVASMASSYTAGYGATGPFVLRTTLTGTAGDGFASANTGLSGTIVNTQEFRAKDIFPTNQGAFDCTASIGFDTQKIFRITAIPGGASIQVSDPANWSAQLTTGNKLHVVRPYFAAERERYVPLTLNPTLTGVSTHSSGTTTINVPSTSMAVGDIIIKDQISAQASLVALTEAETYAAMTFDRLEVVDDGLLYPKPQNIHCHYWLGGVTNTEATKNRRGSAGALTLTGTLVQNRSFYNRQFAAGAYSDANYYILNNTDTRPLSVDTATTPSTGVATFSTWIYVNATPSAPEYVFSIGTSAPNAISLDIGTGRTPRLLMNGSVVTLTGVGNLTLSAWNHVAIAVTESAASVFYLNGTATAFTAGPSADTPATMQLRIGRNAGAGNPAVNLYMADFLGWSNVLLTAAEVASIYNRGTPRRLGVYDSYRKRFTASGLAGQKLSIEATVARTTDADDLRLSHLGVASS